MELELTNPFSILKKLLKNLPKKFLKITPKVYHTKRK